MVYRFKIQNFMTMIDLTTAISVKILCLLLLICSVQSIHLSTRRPRVTKYSKTTVAPGGSTEPATERSLITATYRLQGSGGETCILLTVDALIDISYITKLNERADANTFVPNNANVAGTCKDSDAETLVLSFKDFSLEWSFAKTPGGERWYADSIKLTYNTSSRVLEHAANQGRRVTLSTGSGALLFPTPVGKSFYCPEETVIDLVEEETSSGHRAKLYLRQMRLQAFMFKRGGEWGAAWHCASAAPRSRSPPPPRSSATRSGGTSRSRRCSTTPWSEYREHTGPVPLYRSSSKRYKSFR